MASPGSNLTTTRINRLLRPLRNKCNSLAAVSSSSAASTSAATYSSNPKAWSTNPPLAVLQPARQGGLRALSEDCMRTLDLSRSIYAVRDCFRNVIEVSFGARSKVSMRKNNDSIPSLGAMCSMIIGTTIQEEHDSFSAKGREEADYMDDEAVLELSNETYEAIPTHYRRWATISHALQMILGTCPHHPTLLFVLMEVCCSANLINESNILLRALLLIATSSSSTSPAPISHPAHSSYLIDLCTIWVGGNDTPSVGARSFRTCFTFVNILVDVLTDAGMSDAWTCRATNKLSRMVRKADYASFVHLAGGLARSLGNIEGRAAAAKDKGKARDKTDQIAARHRLTKWVIAMVNQQWVQVDVSAVKGKGLEAAADFLAYAQLSGLHHIHSDMADSQLPNAIISLATCCLAAASSAQLRHEAAVVHFIDLLSECMPITSTFDELIALVLGDETICPGNWHDMIMDKLCHYAAILRSHALLKLEASLWACTVRCLEGDYCIMPSSRCDVEELKRQVAEAVDEAERRCFGSARTGPSPSAASFPGRKRLLNSPRGEWEWEEMVECWIRRSPLVKRPRLVPHSTVNSRRILRSAASKAKPSRPSLPASRSTSPSSTTFPSRTSTRATSEAITDRREEKENYPNAKHRSSLPIVPKTPRILNFASILADAQTNMTVLHRTPFARQSMKIADPLTPSPHYSWKKKSIRDEKLVPPVDEDVFALLPSDDSMDLFACNQSSPMTCR